MAGTECENSGFDPGWLRVGGVYACILSMLMVQDHDQKNSLQYEAGIDTWNSISDRQHQGSK